MPADKPRPDHFEVKRSCPACGSTRSTPITLLPATGLEKPGELYIVKCDSCGVLRAK